MGKKILVVDDAAFMRKMIKDILTVQGHTVVGEAGDGAAAVEQYQLLAPDVVFMDITMPEMSGIDAVVAIKALDSRAQIIMCSAMGQQGMVVDAIRAGAVDFVVKPFNSERIVNALLKVK